ncbi:hypothetical protein BJY04DRAFT_200255 [Aspergillus karnatakaensis]|uniref:uncharacterized protein n=1 Tax=Aspergillus karnatakaensis TaxID=1810916 RepID=UPI003CCD6384
MALFQQGGHASRRQVVRARFLLCNQRYLTPCRIADFVVVAGVILTVSSESCGVRKAGTYVSNKHAQVVTCWLTFRMCLCLDTPSC